MSRDFFPQLLGERQEAQAHVVEGVTEEPLERVA